MADRVRVGIVGCGVISGIYLKNLPTFDLVEVVACADLVLERAQARAAEFGVPRACSPDELLADPAIELVVNLTIPKAHAPVALAAVEAGKSVYNEKPLAVERAQGAELLRRAEAKGVLVGGAPDTFLGGGIQTCRQLIDEGAIGEPVAATAFMANHGHEHWHPDPAFYYQPGGGPLFDMGPYYLTALVSLIGPVHRVAGSARISTPDRIITSEPKRGEKIHVETPTHVAGTLDFLSGAIGTLITSFDVWAHSLPRIEIYGSEGTLAVPQTRPRAGVARRRANARLDGEQPRPRRRRHGPRPALRPPAPRRRPTHLPRPRRHARPARILGAELLRHPRKLLRAPRPITHRPPAHPPRRLTRS